MDRAATYSLWGHKEWDMTEQLTHTYHLGVLEFLTCTSCISPISS